MRTTQHTQLPKGFTNRGFEVVFVCPIHFIGLNIRLCMTKCTHLLFHSPLLCEPIEECGRETQVLVCDEVRGKSLVPEDLINE